MADQQETSTGLQPNLAGLLCYVLGWITGLVFFFLEKENNFIKFHAMQSIVVFGGITVLYIVISIIQGIFVAIFGGIAGGVAGGGISLIISGIFGIITLLISIVSLVLWILLMIKAYQNETYKLPIAGNIAEKQIQ